MTVSVLALFFMCRPGGRLWVDLTHWYHAIYGNPYAPVSKWLYEKRHAWNNEVLESGRFWGLTEGSLPVSSLGSLWTLVGSMFSSRTLSSGIRDALADFSRRLWMVCKFSGSIPVSRGVVIVRAGLVDTKVSGMCHTGEVTPPVLVCHVIHGREHM